MSKDLKLLLNLAYLIILAVAFVLHKSDHFHEFLEVFDFMTYRRIRCYATRHKRQNMELSQKLCRVGE